MIIRKAEMRDAAAIAKTYDELFALEAERGTTTNWVAGVYPTIGVPEEKIPRGEMFVLEEDGELCASLVLNQEQAKEYYLMPWKYPAEDKDVYAIHTLCIRPEKAGRGYGTALVSFAKDYARAQGAKAVRLDTWTHNEPAKALYTKNGFSIVGEMPCLHQGLIESTLVYLECGL